jgi:hypothetical protein
VRRFKVVVLVVALVAGLVSLAACGSSSSQSTALKTYSNSQYGFSLQYDPRFTENSGASAQSGPAGASAVFNIGFLDQKGTIADSKYVDGMLVAVYQLKQSIPPEQVPQVKSQLEALLPQLKAGLQDATLNPLESTTVNGTPGFKLDYTYTSSGTNLQATTYFLVKGDKEYQLTIQSAADKWSQLQPRMDETVRSFSAK